jgi:serine/threonine protein kinase
MTPYKGRVYIGTMLRTLNAKLNRLLIQSKLVFEEKVKVIGTGSDGVVFTSDEIKQEDGKPVAIKLFSAPQYKPHLRDARESISLDQAYREYDALDIIRENPPIPDTAHPNFPRLLGREIDSIERLRINGTTHSGRAVRMEVLENIRSISITSPMWGMEMRGEKIGLNFESRNDNLCDITCQLRSALHYLQGLGLKHRHLEESNIHVRLPDLTVIILDFARAETPLRLDIRGPFRRQYTITPQQIIKNAKSGDAIGYLRINKEIEDEPESVSIRKEQEDIDALYFDSYASALSSAPEYDDVSDYAAARAVVCEAWSTHRYTDLEQYVENRDIIDENNAMETLLLNSVFPKEEPNTLPISITHAIYYSRAKRLEAINKTIAKRGLVECCKRVQYEYVVRTF